MQAKGEAAILYFVIWVVLGNFILLTLFLLAILINNFQDEPVQTQVGHCTCCASSCGAALGIRRM